MKRVLFVPLRSISELKRGDLIRHRSPDSVASYIVDGVYGDRATAVRTIDITNPSEWEVMQVYERNLGNGPEWVSPDAICAACASPRRWHGVNHPCPSFLFSPPKAKP